MNKYLVKTISAVAVATLLVGCSNDKPAKEETKTETKKETAHKDEHKHEHEHEHEHAHEHGHDHGAMTKEEKKIYEGYFEDSHVKDRELSDWEGKWQSVYPYLQDGTLDHVFEAKAKKDSSKTAKEYKQYYTTGYKTDVSKIDIEGDKITFHKGKDKVAGTYKYDGKEILTYEKGNRGVRFIFKKTEGDDKAPKFIQFSDHIIAPEKALHFHIYMGDDRAELLKELEHWPTYYPSDMSGEEIEHEMLAH